MPEERWFFEWCGRVLVLSLLSTAVITGLGAVGVLAHLSDGVLGLVGLTIGCLCLAGAYVWQERSSV